MSLVNNSANNFKDFLDAIKPYLNYQFYDLSGHGVEANNFSTDEKVIGTWIDGKPLYQKTVDCGALPNNTYKQIEHNISNLDKIVYINGISFKNDSSKETKPVSFASTSGSTYNISADAYADYIYITTGSDRTGFHGYVTLRYTKTTDSAVASGEKIVGQWIDGKPLYRKVIDFGAMPNAGQKKMSSGLSGVSVVRLYGIANKANGTTIPLPSASASGSNNAQLHFDSDNMIVVTTAEGYSEYPKSYVVLEYVKNN